MPQSIQRSSEDESCVSWPAPAIAQPSSTGSYGPFDGGTQHEPPLRRRKVGARVGRAAVVPQQEVALAPHVLVHEGALFAVVPQVLEQARAVVRGAGGVER